jgi:prolyl 4-hydroxylase
VHTILVYLNTGFTFGETYFPEIDVKITPKIGRAIHFLNRDSNNNPIRYSVHAGLPVRTGIKYACNIWVRAHSIVDLRENK